MPKRSTFSAVAEHVARLFEPLLDAVEAPDQFQVLLARLGWAVDAVPPGYSVVATALDQAIDAVTALSDDPTVQDVETALEAVKSGYQALQGAALPTGVTAAIADFVRSLIDLLAADYLRDNFPVLFGFLRAANVIVLIDHDETDDRPAFVEVSIDRDALARFFTDPATAWSSFYGWGTDNFDFELLAGHLAAILSALGFQGNIDGADRAELFGYDRQPEVSPKGIDSVLRVPLVWFGSGTNFAQVGLRLMEAPATDARPAGVILEPDVPQLADGIALHRNIRLTMGPGVDPSAPVGLVLSPAGVEVVSRFTDDGQPSSAPSLDLHLVFEPSDPFLIVGTAGGTRLEAGGLDASLALKLTPGATEFIFGLATVGMKLTVSAGDGDGLSQKLLAGQDLKADINTGLRWSTRSGFGFEGSAALTVDIPVHAQIGPLEIDGVRLKVAGELGTPSAVRIETSVGFEADIGPVVATVDHLGVSFHLQLGDGNAGPVDTSIGFKLPDGVGIDVDAGPVSGGGFLSLDADAGRYSGAVQLSVYDIAVSAFGLVETKVPGGGFSFVILISAEFTPIQLGFGFTLNGVGGLIGINRSVDGNALAGLVRAGHSEELLFPRNVIANAPAIIRDLGTVFPARQGHYVFGPLAKLGWGTPTLITGEIGIILELPGPVLAIVGEVKCALPKPDAPLLKLNMSVGGELDFPNKSFALDAALHDSVVNGFPISGQMAMRVRWGEEPNFVLAVGGFHPAYQPPPDFPKLQPLAVDFGSQGAAAITVSGFFAITPNTLQIGGDARLHAGGSGISLDATVGVKALFVFTPFSFDARIDASVKISFHGHGPCVHLSGELSGPSPWHVRGEVCVSILFWDACLGFDTTFGGDQQVTQPELDPWVGDPANGIAGLGDALADAGHWAAVAPAGSVAVVTLAAGDQTLVDPLGGLTIKQKVVPLETTQPLTRFGVANVTAPVRFTLGSASLVDDQGNLLTGLSTLSPVNDFFAPAQYFDMNDAKKLSSSGFEQRQAGYVLAENSNNLRPGSHASRTMKYTTLVLGSDGSFTTAVDYTASSDQVSSQARKSAAGLSGAGQAGTRRFTARSFAQPFDILQPVHVLASMTALTAVAGAPAAAPRSAALIALDAFRAQSPAQRLEVQVAATHELA